jgi:VanZ family protein
MLTLMLVAGIASLYGATDEVHQLFVPGRNCNAWDWAADTVGAALGAAVYLRVESVKRYIFLVVKRLIRTK